MRFFLDIAQGCAGRLVEPVGRHPGLGNLVHVLGADLDFHRGTKRAEESGVQGLIAIGFWNGDVVFEFSGNWFVKRVQCAQGEVATG